MVGKRESPVPMGAGRLREDSDAVPIRFVRDSSFSNNSICSEKLRDVIVSLASDIFTMDPLHDFFDIQLSVDILITKLNPGKQKHDYVVKTAR